MREFSAFTQKYSGPTNRIVTDVDVFPAFDPKSPPEGWPKPFRARGLWDTGATASCISPEVATNLKLASVGISNVNHAGGVGTSSKYLVNFFLPNSVGVAGVLVHEFAAVPGDFGVIIGMDIISRGDFAVTHEDGKGCVSFRMPSCGQIDFVEEANRARMKLGKVGRNDPCMCGKTHPDGRPVKFKHCHGSGHT